MNQQTNSKQTKAEKALAVALDIRKFEIELYWKRAAYFWAFLALILGSYFTVLTTTAKEMQRHPLLKAVVLLIISCLGIVFSVAWCFVNRGSKFWQENWENHVDLLEDSVHGPLHKRVLSAHRPCFWRLLQPYPFSMSKINQFLSLVIIGAFVLLTLVTAGATLLHSVEWWPSLLASRRLASWGMVLAGAVTVFVVYLLGRYGESALGKRSRSHERLNVTDYKEDFDLNEAATSRPTSMGTETETQTETLWVWSRDQKR